MNLVIGLNRYVLIVLYSIDTRNIVLFLLFPIILGLIS